MNDRNMLKWLPFNSIINGNNLVKLIDKENSKINKPILSEEQIILIENNLLESLINQIPLKFKIYKNGYYNELIGIVQNIDSIKGKIYLNNSKALYFREIISALIISIC